MFRWMLLGALATPLICCATLRNDQTVCEDSRDLRCAAEPECSFDSSRGCRVCHCGPVFHEDPRDPHAVPGDPVPR